jgi:hypothetical protein
MLTDFFFTLADKAWSAQPACPFLLTDLSFRLSAEAKCPKSSDFDWRW